MRLIPKGMQIVGVNVCNRETKANGATVRFWPTAAGLSASRLSFAASLPSCGTKDGSSSKILREEIADNDPCGEEVQPR